MREIYEVNENDKINFYETNLALYDIVDGNIEVVPRDKIKNFSDKIYNLHMTSEELYWLNDKFEENVESKKIKDTDFNYLVSCIYFVTEIGCNSLVLNYAIENEYGAQCLSKFWTCVEYFDSIKKEFKCDKETYYKLTDKKIEEYDSYFHNNEKYKEKSCDAIFLEFIRELMFFGYDIERVNEEDSDIGIDKIIFKNEVNGKHQLREYVHYWAWDSGYCDALRISWT